MDHYEYKAFDLFWDIKMANRAKAVKKNKYYKFARKHYKTIVALTAVMSFALILKTNFEHFYGFR